MNVQVESEQTIADYELVCKSGNELHKKIKFKFLGSTMESVKDSKELAAYLVNGFAVATFASKKREKAFLKLKKTLNQQGLCIKSVSTKKARQLKSSNVLASQKKLDKNGKKSQMFLVWRKSKVTKSQISQEPCVKICKPRTDDRLLWDIMMAPFGYQATLVAHDLKLFSLLAQPHTLTEICDALNLNPHPAEALLTVIVSLGLIEIESEYYSLTPIAEDYLLENSPTYFGGVLNLNIANNEVFSSFSSLKKAVISNSSSFYNQGKHQKFFDPNHTRAMHSHSMGAALAWSEKIDLSQYTKMLDIGGGSGGHSIAATLKYTSLQAIVLDHSSACEVAQEFIAKYGLQNRIQTFAGDMWKDSYPEADVHLYSQVCHGEPPEQVRILIQKSFDSLPSGGRIIINEMLYNDQKTGPYQVAAHNLLLFLIVGGQKYSGYEYSTILSEIGFVDVEVKSTFGYWSIVTGCKP